MGDVDLSEKRFYVRGFSNDTEKTTARVREAFGGIKLLSDGGAKDIAFICEADGRSVLNDRLDSADGFVPVSVIPVL